MAEAANMQRYAQERREQTGRRRDEILDAAQALLLARGPENVSMKEIAEAAHISKMTLYRYFPGMDPIAFEIAVRMLREIYSSIGREKKPESIVGALITAVRQFHDHEHAYRYLGMFDHLYAQNYPSDDLAQWYKEHIDMLDRGFRVPQSKNNAFHMTLGNLTMGFLEKLAARGGLLEKEQQVPVETQLNEFIKMLEILDQNNP